MDIQRILVQTLVLGHLQANCYIVTDRATSNCAIIDPADNADSIYEEITNQNLTPVVLIATHAHFDHILATNELQKVFEIPLLIHPNDIFLLKRMVKSAKYWLHEEIHEKPSEYIESIDINQKIKIGKTEFQLIHTPGHTPGGISIYNQEEKIIFTGDTLFKQSVGRSDLSYSNTQDLNKSVSEIKTKFKGYKAYPGHEESFYI